MSFQEKVSNQLIRALRANRGGAVSVGESVNNTEWFEQYLDAIKLMLETEEGISTTQLKQVKSVIEYRTDMSNLQLKYNELESKQGIARAEILKDIHVANIAAQKAYYAKTRVADRNLILQLRGKIRQGGRDPLKGIAAISDALYSTGTRADGTKGPLLTVNDPGFVVTVNGMVNELNDSQKPNKIIEIRPDGFIDIKATRALLSSKYTRDMSAPSVVNMLDMLNEYNAALRQERVIDDRLQTQGDLAERQINQAIALINAGKEEAGEQALEAAMEVVDSNQASFERGTGMMSAEAAQSIIQEAHVRKRTHRAAKKAVAYAESKLSVDEQDEVREGLAKGIGNSGFRAWAADHGFDRLGSVGFDEEGNLDVSTYRQGGDDVAALLAWKEQSMRRPGEFGLKNVWSGEVWSIQLKDGTTVTGDRMKRHAADPMGAIRIATEDGARLIRTEDADYAEIRERKAYKQTRADRKAKRKYQRQKGKYARLDATSRLLAGEQNIEDLAMVGTDYIVDPNTNRAVRIDEFEAAQSQARRNRIFSADVDGTDYIVDPVTAKIYAVSSEGISEVTDATQRGVLLEKIPPDGGLDVLAKEVDGVVSLLSQEDLSALIAGEFRGELYTPRTDPDKSKAIEGATINALTPEGLGFTREPEVPATPVTGPGSDVAGFWVIDPAQDTRGIADTDELRETTGLDQAQTEQLIEQPPTPEDGADPNLSAPAVVGSPFIDTSILPEMIESLVDKNKTPEQREKLAKFYNDNFGDQYFLLYGNLHDSDLGFKLPKPKYAPAMPRDQSKVDPDIFTEDMDEPEVDEPEVDEFEVDESEVDEPTPEVDAASVKPDPSESTSQDSFTDAGAMSMFGKPRPGVGDKTPKSLKSVPMSQDSFTDPGAMSMKVDPRALAPATTIPSEESTSGDVPTDVGDVAAPSLKGAMSKVLGLLKKKKKAKKKKPPEPDKVDDAALDSSEVPGEKGPQANPKANRAAISDDEFEAGLEEAEAAGGRLIKTETIVGKAKDKPKGTK